MRAPNPGLRPSGSAAAALAAALLAGAAGCLDYEVGDDPPTWPDSHPEEPPGSSQEDRIVQAVSPVVDALFVIDNSCSMRDEQDALTSNFFRFIDFFDGSGLDFHVGVVSTDLDDPQHQGRLLPDAEGRTWIDPTTPDPVSVFTQIATMGTTGSGTERGLGATHLALEVHGDTFNAGFYREEASIHTVVVSDEQDQTDDTIISQEEFVDWYSALKRRGHERSFSSIVTMVGPDAGTVYLDVTEAIGGTAWDIGTASWDEVLERLGLQASGMKREFFLSRLPDEASIEVEIERPDGTVLSDLVLALGDPPVGDFTYDRRRNSVTFVQLVPEPFSTVVIRYALRNESAGGELLRASSVGAGDGR